MLSTIDAQTLLSGDGNVLDSDGSKVGSIGQIFLDDTTNEPAWVTVKTGWFGTGESFVPLDQATVAGDDLTVPYGKDMIKDAPRVDDAEGHLTAEEENDLYTYYSLDHDEDRSIAPAPTDAGFTDQASPVVPSETGTETADEYRDAAGESNESTTSSSGDTAREFVGDREPVGQDTSGPTTDSSMTRSEEQLHVGTTTQTVGRARLRKFIVTENVSTTVPVSHEEVQVVREPITEDNRDAAMAGGDLTEEEHEIELTADRVVVDKDVVPVERVRLDTQTVTEDQQVDETVRKEQIESDTDQDGVTGSSGPVADGLADERGR